MTRTLVVGWFSYAGMGATAGDVLAAGAARDLLRRCGREVTVAAVPPFAGDVDLAAADPAAFDELAFVCGPFGNGWPITELLDRFAHCRLVGLDVSLLQPLSEWNPFDLLCERDSDRRTRPDLVLATDEPLLPVVGLIEVHPQSEYGDRGRHDEVGRAIREALGDGSTAVVPIDTALERNANGLTNAAQVESLVARCDAVVTTRLHGMVFALKHGVPAVVVDPIDSGAKVTRQARALGWPYVLEPPDTTADSVRAMLRECLTPAAAELARQRAAAARRVLQDDLDGLAARLRAAPERVVTDAAGS